MMKCYKKYIYFSHNQVSTEQNVTVAMQDLWDKQCFISVSRFVSYACTYVTGNKK